MNELGIGLALACAAVANVSMLCKHRGANEVPAVCIKSPARSAAALFRSRWWTIGFIVAALAWVLHVAAIAVAPLSLVQAVIAGGIVLLAFPAERYFGCRLGRREWGGLALAALGLGFLALDRARVGGGSELLDRSPDRVRVGRDRSRVRDARLGRPRRRPARRPRRSSRGRLGRPDRRLQRRDQDADRGDGEGAASAQPMALVGALAGVGAFFSFAAGRSSARRSRRSPPPSSPRPGPAILGGVPSSATRSAPASSTALARGAAFVAVILRPAPMPAPGNEGASPRTRLTGVNFEAE